MKKTTLQSRLTKMLKGKIVLNPQEGKGNYSFMDVPAYMTKGFQSRFASEATLIAFLAVSLIQERYPDDADYFQTFQYNYPDGEEVRFWIIHDESHITILLPEEY